MSRLHRWTLALILVTVVLGVGIAAGTAAGATAEDAEHIVPDVDTETTTDSDSDDSGSDDSDADDSDSDDSDADGSDSDDSDADDSDSGDSDSDDSDSDDSDADDSDSDDSDADDSDSDDSDSDDSDETDAPDPAAFTITDVETNTPTTVGESLEVTVSLENTGEESAIKEVSFNLGEYLKDDADVELDPGQTKSVTLTYVTKSGDGQDWTLTVETPDDDHQQTVTVEETSRESDDSGSSGSSGSSSGGGSSYTAGTPEFEIDEFDSDDALKAGETVRMNATVTNTGTASGERLVWFTLGNRTINETVVDLDLGTETTLSYEYNTTVNESGEWTLSAHTPDDQVDRSVAVAELQSNVTISDVETSGPVTADERLDVTVTVNNTGDIGDEQAITLLLNDQRMDTRNVTVPANESTTVTLTYWTSEQIVGDLDLSVTTADDSETFSATVNEKPSESTDASTDTQTDTADDSDSDTPAEQASGPTDDSVPGFGLVVALLALLAASGVVARRKQ